MKQGILFAAAGLLVSAQPMVCHGREQLGGCFAGAVALTKASCRLVGSLDALVEPAGPVFRHRLDQLLPVFFSEPATPLVRSRETVHKEPQVLHGKRSIQ